jgi:murein DD-endopeptidase MepM/ murein hydrolase activator NlpD
MPRVKISKLPKMFVGGGFTIPNAVIDFTSMTTTTTTVAPVILPSGAAEDVNLEEGRGGLLNENVNLTSKTDVNKCPEGFYKNKQGQCVPKVIGPAQSWINAIGSMSRFASVANTIQENKAFNRKLNMYGLPEYSMASNAPTDRYGDYFDLTGQFNPRYTGFKSKGMYTDPFYASSSTPMAQEGGQQDFNRVPGDYEVMPAMLPDPNADMALFGAPQQQAVAMPTGTGGAQGVAQGGSPMPTNVGANDVVTTADGAILPIPAYSYWRIASGFGRRIAPTKGASTNHNGIDISVPENTNLFSPKPGTIHLVNYSKKGGNQVVIYHDDGTRSGFAHLNQAKVKQGQRVGAGEVIGLSGGKKGHPGAGVSTGEHLHFTYGYINGDLIDPATVFDFESYTSKKRGKTGGNTQQTVGSQEPFKQTLPVGFTNMYDLNPWAPNTDIAASHNNPLNLHYSNRIAAKYGATPGKLDGNSGERVAIFPNIESGIQANANLLFQGENYRFRKDNGQETTVSDVRNRWVTGNYDRQSHSTPSIIKAMGGNKKISSLSPEEKKKLFLEFLKNESSSAASKYGPIIQKLPFNYKEGGENSGTMKIRIVGIPDQELDQMAYGGQSNYGLDVGYQHLFNTMNENQYEKNMSNTVKEEEETPEDPYVLEAEGGENYITPDGEFKKIVGDSHANGGVKLKDKQIPKKSFMFSQTKSLKIGGPILENFGKNGKGKKKYTPAELAKQYDTTHPRAILQNPYSRPDQKRTAELGIDARERKLAELAMVQESMKGFPDGIPEIAMPYMGMQEGQNIMAYGGMHLGNKEMIPTFQKAGERTFALPGGRSVTASKVTAPGAGFVPYTGVADLYWAAGAPGSYGAGYTVSGGRSGASFTVEDILNNPTRFKTFHARMAGAPESEKRKAAELLYTRGTMPGQWTPGTEDQFQYVEASLPGTVSSGGNTTTGGNPPVGTNSTTTTTTIMVPPKVNPNNFVPPNRNIPYGWTQQDINNLGTAYINAATIKKYHPRLGRLAPEIPRPVFQDWLAQAQQIYGSQYLPAARTVQQYTSPQGLTANLSYLSGKTGENIGAAISGVGAYNAPLGTQADATRADIMNKFNALNAQNLAEAVKDENSYDARFWGAIRGSNRGITATRNQGITTAGQLYGTNVTESPYFYFNPRLQDLRFNNTAAQAAFNTALQQQKGFGSTTPNMSVSAYAKQLLDRGDYDYIDDKKEREKYAIAEATRMLTGNRTSTTINPFNPSAMTQRFTGYAPPTNPYDPNDMYGSPY